MSVHNSQLLHRSMRDNSIELKASDMPTVNNFMVRSTLKSMRWENGTESAGDPSKRIDGYHLSKRIRAPGSRLFKGTSSQFQSNVNLSEVVSPNSNEKGEIEDSRIAPIPHVLELPILNAVRESRYESRGKMQMADAIQNHFNPQVKALSKLQKVRPALQMIIRKQQPAVKLNFISLGNSPTINTEDVHPAQPVSQKNTEQKATNLTARRHMLMGSTVHSRTTSELFKVKHKLDLKKFLYRILDSPKRVEKKVTVAKLASKPKAFMINSSSRLVVGKVGHKSTLKSVEFPSMLMCQGMFGPFLLIFGGLSSFIHDDFILYNFTDQTYMVKNYSKHFDLSRFGHSMDQIGNTVYIFGGSNSFLGYINRNLNINFNNLNPEFFGLSLDTWKIREVKHSNFSQPTPRKFHGSFVLDNTYLFVFGGIRPNDKFAKDLWIFDTYDNNWHEFKVTSDSQNLSLVNGLAHHKLLSMSSHIQILKTEKIYEETQKDHSDTPRRPIYLFKSDKKHIALDVYLFGGINGNNEIITNDLWQLCMKNKHFYFKKVSVAEGHKPEKRHSHSMAKISADSFIVYGGRGHNNTFLNSVDSFSFGSKSWSSLSLVNNEWSGEISSHAVTAHESVIFIFGGISQSGFLEPNIYYCGFS